MQAKPATSSAKAPSLRDAQREFTRQTLVDAATAVFQRQGYLDATIDDIAEAAGASRGTFYLHFKSKAAVIAAAVEAQRRTEDPHVTETWPPDYEPEIVELEASVEAHIDRMIRQRELLRAWRQAQALEPELQHVPLDELEESVGRWTRLGIVGRRRHGDKRDVEQIKFEALMLHGEMQALFDFWLLRGYEIDRRTAVAHIARRWYEVMFGEPPPRASKTN
jgi:AcrR family transcriptional regulator